MVLCHEVWCKIAISPQSLWLLRRRTNARNVSYTPNLTGEKNAAPTLVAEVHTFHISLLLSFVIFISFIMNTDRHYSSTNYVFSPISRSMEAFWTAMQLIDKHFRVLWSADTFDSIPASPSLPTQTFCAWGWRCTDVWSQVKQKKVILPKWRQLMTLRKPCRAPGVQSWPNAIRMPSKKSICILQRSWAFAEKVGRLQSWSFTNKAGLLKKILDVWCKDGFLQEAGLLRKSLAFAKIFRRLQ